MKKSNMNWDAKCGNSTLELDCMCDSDPSHFLLSFSFFSGFVPMIQNSRENSRFVTLLIHNTSFI